MTEQSSRSAIEEVPIAEQIEEVEREIGKRTLAYTRRIADGKMSREVAIKRMTRMRAVLRTLQQRQDYELQRGKTVLV